MAQLVFFGLVSLVFLALMVRWALRKPRPVGEHVSLDELLPAQHREYHSVTERLASCNERLREIQSERRHTALAYLEGLRDDFLRVERLLNHASKFLPDLKPHDEFARFARALWFRCEFLFLRSCIRMGFVPSIGLRALTREVSGLAAWADQVLAQVASRRGLPVLQADLNRS